MTRLTLVSTNTRPNSNLAHRASTTEGEAAQRLLEAQGYPLRRKSNGQLEFRCPFHEGPGEAVKAKSSNFYMNAVNSKYECKSASCGERGNLQTLERYFGIEAGDSDAFVNAFKSREEQLRVFERLLVKALRTPFYEHGLTDATIERFRLGFEPQHEVERNGRTFTIPDRYVIPYLVGRRPKFFRYYNPTGDPKWKYTWEEGAEGTLFNAQDAMGDTDGRVFLCEGEQKAMLLVQLGYAAVAVPGATMWKDEFQAAFTHARQVYVLFDNDNPAFHMYDKVDEGKFCQKCKGKGLDRCMGHNPGQEAAGKRVDQIGWRAKNIILPWPHDEVPKTDVNDYFTRDGHSNAEFAELVTGKRQTQYQVQTLAEISETPPDEAQFLVDQGILPKGGRLLIAGKPKVGKSIFVDNLALSLASGIPFLGRFPVTSGDPHRPGVRTLLLDRELSKWSLYKRMHQLMDDRPGYRAAMENLLIDHDHLVRLDHPGAYDVLAGLIQQNGAEVVIFDTAYKFLGGDVESSASLMKAFGVLDKLIHETGVSLVMTHHLRKGQQSRGKENTDIADPDGVAGSFLWTGWPNATILLNYMSRSVENPFNSVATFTAFRDAAAPEPLALYRDRGSISYSAVVDHVHGAEDSATVSSGGLKVSTELVHELLLETSPTTEDDFIATAQARFGVSAATVRPFFLDAMATGHFERTSGKPPVIKFKYDEGLQTWESEHHLPERDIPFTDVAFDMADL